MMVCLGGAAGTGARYLFGLWAVKTFGTRFPWGTLFINTIGSFLIVLVLGMGTGRAGMSPEMRLVLATGVMGGFTTYSSFNYEALRLFQHGEAGLSLLYIFATLFGCLVAGVLD